MTEPTVDDLTAAASEMTVDELAEAQFTEVHDAFGDLFLVVPLNPPTIQ